MTFADFKTLVEASLQDGHSKLPSSTKAWNVIIKEDIKHILSDISINEVATFVAYTDLVDDDSIISIDELLTSALINQTASRYAQDVNDKQLLFLKRDSEISTFLWNKYRETILTEDI